MEPVFETQTNKNIHLLNCLLISQGLLYGPDHKFMVESDMNSDRRTIIENIRESFGDLEIKAVPRELADKQYQSVEFLLTLNESPNLTKRHNVPSWESIRHNISRGSAILPYIIEFFIKSPQFEEVFRKNEVYLKGRNERFLANIERQKAGELLLDLFGPSKKISKHVIISDFWHGGCGTYLDDIAYQTLGVTRVNPEEDLDLVIHEAAHSYLKDAFKPMADDIKRREKVFEIVDKPVKVGLPLWPVYFEETFNRALILAVLPRIRCGYNDQVKATGLDFEIERQNRAGMIFLRDAYNIIKPRVEAQDRNYAGMALELLDKIDRK